MKYTVWYKLFSTGVVIGVPLVFEALLRWYDRYDRYSEPTWQRRIRHAGYTVAALCIVIGTLGSVWSHD